MIPSVFRLDFVVLSIPVWAYFLYRAWKVMGFVPGGPSLMPRTNSSGNRLWRVIVRYSATRTSSGPPVGQRRTLGRDGGLPFGIVVWFEAYIQTFNSSWRLTIPFQLARLLLS